MIQRQHLCSSNSNHFISNMHNHDFRRFRNSAFSSCLTLFACTSARKSGTNQDKDLDKLLSFMVGDFSSQAQSLRDSAFFDIRLHIRPIWAADKHNHWL